MGFWCLGGAWSGIGGDLWGAVASMGILHGILMKLIKKKHKVTLIFPKISEVLPRTDCQAKTVDQLTLHDGGGLLLHVAAVLVVGMGIPELG